jgi:hypothetical protein
MFLGRLRERDVRFLAWALIVAGPPICSGGLPRSPIDVISTKSRQARRSK